MTFTGSYKYNGATTSVAIPSGIFSITSSPNLVYNLVISPTLISHLGNYTVSLTVIDEGNVKSITQAVFNV